MGQSGGSRRAGVGDLARTLWPVLHTYWRAEVGLALLIVLELAFSFAIPLSTKYLFDDIIPSQDYRRLAVWIAAVVIVFALASACSFARELVAGQIGEHSLRDLRRTTFAHVQRLPLAFYTRSKTGDVLARMMGDIDTIHDVLGAVLPGVVLAVLRLGGGAAMLLLLNWQLGLIVLLLGIPAFGALYTPLSHRLRAASRQGHDQLGETSSFLQEQLAGQLVVKSFDLFSHAQASFEDYLARAFASGMRAVRLGGLLSASTSGMFLGLRLVVLAVGAALVIQGGISVGTLVALVGLIAEVIAPVMSIASEYRQLQAATGAFERVQELLDEPPEADPPGAVELAPLRHGITFDAVSFSYRAAGTPELHELSLFIPAGSRVAIVGPSGAGKSTLTALLLRLYEPGSGRVLFDGQDIQRATLQSLRGQIGVVPQESYLFNTSIAENIALGQAGASQLDIEQAARQAAVHEAIQQLDGGYQAVVGERGQRLSGGQRQRVAIARALVRDPRLLILDEATSALDPVTEASIAESVTRAGQGRTTIMVTHRLSSAATCDRIFVLDRGRLVEQGTHPELMRAEGLYWRLYQQQAARAAPPAHPRRKQRMRYRSVRPPMTITRSPAATRRRT
jgi:ATP-binding cassette subfamily B protein